jgi:hypothetical protein
LAFSGVERRKPSRRQGGGVTARYDAANQRASTQSLLARDETNASTTPTQGKP